MFDPVPYGTGEFFSHRNNRKTFDVKKMTFRSEKNRFSPYNVCKSWRKKTARYFVFSEFVK